AFRSAAAIAQQQFKTAVAPDKPCVALAERGAIRAPDCRARLVKVRSWNVEFYESGPRVAHRYAALARVDGGKTPIRRTRDLWSCLVAGIEIGLLICVIRHWIHEPVEAV